MQTGGAAVRPRTSAVSDGAVADAADAGEASRGGGLVAGPRRVDPLTAFCALWGAYLLLHQSMTYWSWLQFKDPIKLAWGAGLFALCAAVVLRPRSLALFAALILGLVVQKWRGMPHHSNHDFLTLCMNVTILLTIAWHTVSSRGGVARLGAARDALLARLAALLGLELLAMYFWVVVHKLNRDYLDPAVSCGVEMYANIAERIPVFPTGAWTHPFTIGGSLAAEAGIPLLLLFRRTRLLGVGVGIAFHLMLSLHENQFVYDFSAMLYALYFLFLPADVRGALVDHWRQSWIGRATAKLATGRGVAVLIGVAGAAGAVVAGLVVTRVVGRAELIDWLHEVAPPTVRAAWFVLAAVSVYFFTRAVVTARFGRGARGADDTGQSDAPDDGDGDGATAPARGLFRPALSPLLVLPVLVFANGFSPYLGLKTESSFAMFANIHTEGGRNNHLFMPVVPLTNYQDVVEVLETTDGRLRTAAEAGYGLTRFDFQTRLSRTTDPDFSVTFRLNYGEPTTLTRAEHGDTEWFQPHSTLERKLLHFRTVQLEGPQQCGH